ncbi:MAG: hypothetical protein NT161_00600 [Candidatus Nomurabacteria bacterium]|nr:hypothetical protein [Candidatus Nomurabacteria bacterium]
MIKIMQRNWIKKGIVGIIMLAIFLAPFSGGVKVNKAEAEVTPDPNNSNLQLENNGEKLILTSPTRGIGYASAIFDIKAINLKTEIVGGDNSGYKLNTGIIDITDPKTNDNTFILTEGKAFGKEKDSNEKTIRICYGTSKGAEDKKPCDSSDSTGLKEDTDYKLKVEFYEFEEGARNGNSIVYFWTFKTGNKADNTSGNTTGDVKSYNNNIDSYNLNCGTGFWLTGGGSLGGCIAAIFYVFWEASAWVARMAGGFLDFFVYYSTNDSSYRNLFIEKGWGAIRDIANILFIISLLYVAIKTILGLNVTDNKRLVGAVIIIGLIINFSLFTTKVVIDTSNILAKIFYNNITSEKAGSTGAVTGSGGEKSISVGMIAKFNPQEIISSDSYAKNGPGMFLFVTIILLAITLYTAYIFFSVALLFVTRVVSLWIAMIFSPLAFVSYAVPFEIPEFGHKEWWSNLLKNCFLAPIFIFFLYIIVLFLDIGKNITYNTVSTDPLQKIMGVVIPFVILFFLLKMAKEIAVKYSGKMGEAVMTGAKMIGGVALGAATGGAALLGSSTIGKYAQKVANKDDLRAQASGDKEHFAKMGITDVNVQKKMQAAAQKKLARANYFAKSSFDIRQTGAGKGFSKVSGMDLSKGLGIKATSTEQLKGGRHAQQEREKEKGIERMKTYELTGAAAAEQNDLATKAKVQNNRATQYKEDKEKAKKFINDNGGVFDEQDFKENYEKGENLKDRGYGLDKKVDVGSIKSVEKIKTAAEVNEGRRRAYANSLQDKADIDKARGAIKTFFAEWGKGMKKMVTTPGGLATTAGLGIATGGVFVAPTIIGGGFLKALKETMKVRTTDSEVIAAIRKGENPNKDLIRELKKMTEKGHSDSGKLSDIAKKMLGGEEGEKKEGH